MRSVVLAINRRYFAFINSGSTLKFSYNGFPCVAISRTLCTDKDGKKAGPFLEYKNRIAAGKLTDGDAFQLRTLRELQRVYDELVESSNACHLDQYSSSFKAGRSWWLSRFFSLSSYSPVRGLYLYGGVGTGKTMLMDLFFDQLPSNWRKKRIHFHDFMLNVHSSLHKHNGVEDPLELVAHEISNESILLCLDEFMVTNIGDAFILNRLYKHLFSNGVILLATSNRAPDNLYKGGLNRDNFHPFISTLKERCVVHEIGSSTDYRKMTSALQGFYFVGKDLSGLVFEKFEELIDKHVPTMQEVEVVMGRKLQVPFGANGCAYFRFEDLCNRPLSAADYFGLFKNFHTLVLDGVPVFALHNRPAAYRFVLLVDVMYESKARLVCTAEGIPNDLFENIVTILDAKQMASGVGSNIELELCVDNQLAFAKERTISRENRNLVQPNRDEQPRVFGSTCCHYIGDYSLAVARRQTGIQVKKMTGIPDFIEKWYYEY